MFRALLPVLALLVALAPEAQPVLHGRLLTPDGVPRANERIQIESGVVARGVLDSTRTDAEGRFTISLPGPYLYGLGMGPGWGEWVPLAAQEASGESRIDLEVRLGDLAMENGFAATSSLPVIADLMNVYAEAERWHRTPVETPQLLAMQADGEARINAAPLAEKEALRDSLGAEYMTAYKAITSERARTFLAGRTPEAHPLLREGYALTAFDKVHKDSAQAAMFIERVPASSPLWSFEGLSGPGVGNLIAYAARELGHWDESGPSESFHAYVRYLAMEYPDPNVRQRALQRLFEFDRERDEEAARATYDLLVRDFPDSREAEVIRRSWADTRAVRPGEPVPTFSLPALPDTTATVASSDVAGITYLLDFWGSWCMPCVREMPKLHELHERYAASGFEIVSIAVFDTPESVARFQSKGFPMPWLHGLVTEGDWETREALQARFEFVGYPSAILVGPDGVILAEGAGARGEELERALALHFGG
ncbi:redoxin domain-containing protein [Rubricoccus marinus]|uniref:Thioredoxin domain-containing protein n=1 Tax=Rubricoccus marinus TaxID=716817 RepID=A0A259U020_9BACT|nr:redoxin domain-containing protein [Rubricoccus marinus]OZC03290.1 hypothetical protein BSZ36_10045 [Rubricoccus marinus]